ncbi:MAG: PEGA domain-containing protein [Methanosarcina sp.]
MEIEPGTHTVTVYLSGYNPQQEKVEIENSETKTLSYTPVPETKTTQASTPNQEKRENNPEPAATKTEPIAKYQDTDRAAVMSRNAFIIADDASKIGDASADSDFVSVSFYASALYFDSLKAIEDSNKYVSPALQPAKDEFEDALHYGRREGGSNIVLGIDEINQGRTDEGIKYINTAVSDLNKCTEHTNTANKVLEKYQTKLK